MKAKVLAVLTAASFIVYSCNDDGGDVPSSVNQNDRDFTLKASLANTAEIEAGALAASKGTETSIIAFGQFMVADHGTARNELKDIADDLGLPAPDSLDAEHVALKAQLESLTGRAFDSVYIHSQVADHQKALQLFQDEVNNGRNGRLIDFAAEQLPHLQLHFQKADSIAANY